MGPTVKGKSARDTIRFVETQEEADAIDWNVHTPVQHPSKKHYHFDEQWMLCSITYDVCGFCMRHPNGFKSNFLQRAARTADPVITAGANAVGVFVSAGALVLGLTAGIYAGARLVTALDRESASEQTNDNEDVPSEEHTDINVSAGNATTH